MVSVVEEATLMVPIAFAIILDWQNLSIAASGPLVVQLTEAGTIVAVLEVASPFKVGEASLVEVVRMKVVIGIEVVGIIAATWEEAFTFVDLKVAN